ncbi:MAG: YhgE/Pip domain-containing protein [Clostridia bacterium]|nr:YhgE/Pip domain-containing protein [Clostridia bacterium]
MKNVFKIYSSDLAKIISSWATAIIIIGITILPPAYAWINIYASWDPYGNTKGIKVAVVNEDKGASIRDIELDIGGELISSLKTNDKLGWVFCDSSEEGMKMVEDGNVYATIIIPEDFSLRLTTFVDKNPTKPAIEYYVNEKQNAIAPKMTNAAATSLQNQISSTIIDTVVEKVFEKLNEIGVDTEEKYPQIQKYIDLLHVLNDNFPELSERLDKLSNKAKDGIVKLDGKDEDFIFIQDTIDQLVDFNNNFSDTIADMKDKISAYTPEVRSDLESVQTLLLDVSNAAGTLINDIETNKPVVSDDIDDAIKDLNTFREDVNKIRTKLLNFNNGDLKDIIKLTDSILSDIEKIQTLLSEVKSSADDLQKVESLAYDLSILCSDISSSLHDLKNDIDSIYEPIDNALDELETIVSQLESLVDTIENSGISSDISFVITGLENSLTTINAVLSPFSKIFGGVIAANTGIISDLQTISENVGNNNALSNLKTDLSNLNTYISTSRTKLYTQNDNLEDALDDAEDIFSQASVVCKDLNVNSAALRKSINTNIDSISATLDDVSGILKNANTELSDLQNEGDEKITSKTQDILDKTDKLISRLSDFKTDINDRNTMVSVLGDTQKAAFNLQSSVGTILNNMDDEKIERLQSRLSDGLLLLSDISTVLKNGKKTVSDLAEFSHEAADTGEIAVERLDKIREELPDAQSDLKYVLNKIDDVSREISFDDLISFLKSDPETEGDFISSPVELTTHSVYQMQNYGTGLTPFYSVLALWVGGLFLGAMLTTQAKNALIAYTPSEEYFGKYLLFATIAFFQGLITALGDLFILGIGAHNPILFVLLCIFTSLIFSMIIYSLVSTLGNVGKAVSIILLLLQITGSGGTFPIQVTPSFFQTIHNMLPFTYAISGVREAIFGVAFDPLMKDIGMLLMFGTIFTLYGRFLKKPLNNILERFSHEQHQSGVFH